MTWGAIAKWATIVAVLAACIVFALRFWPDSPVAKPAPNALAGEPTQPPMQIDVVTFRPEVKKKLKLPKPVQDNPQQHVVAATRIEVDEDRPVEVSAVIDEHTGETTLYERELPTPLFAWSSKATVGAYIGIKEDGQPTIRAIASREIARVKGLAISGIGMADISAGGIGGFVGIGMEF